MGDLVPDNLKASLDRWLDEQLLQMANAAKQQLERQKSMLADQQRAAMLPGLLGSGQMRLQRPGQQHVQWHHPGGVQQQHAVSNGVARSQQQPLAITPPVMSFGQMMANGRPQEVPFDLKVSITDTLMNIRTLLKAHAPLLHIYLKRSWFMQ